MTCLCNTLVLSSRSGNFYVYMQHSVTNYVYLFLHTHTHMHHSLNPEKDPLCALLLIDYCAVRAGEYKFIIDLFHAWEVSLTHTHTHTHTHFSLLPLASVFCVVSQCSLTGTSHRCQTLPSLSLWPCSTARRGRERRRDKGKEIQRPTINSKMPC